MKRNTKRLASLRGRVIAALRRVNLLPNDAMLGEDFIHLVRSAVTVQPDIKKRYPEPIPPRVLENVAMLKISFGLSNADIASIISGDLIGLEKTLRVRESEITFLAEAYAHAISKFPYLKNALTSGKSLEDIALFDTLFADRQSHFVISATNDAGWPKPAIPLHMAEMLKKVRWSDKFQNNDPDAICLVAEKYIDVGAIDIAESLIDQVFEALPEHAGGLFQKARLLMSRSDQVMRQASRYRLMSEEAEALSAAEGHYEYMAGEEVDAARSLRLQAFSACVRAYKQLPENHDYEKSAIQWSADYGKLRGLRRKVLTFIVWEAGKLADPYNFSSPQHDRVKARLGRDSKWPGAPRLTSDTEEMALLSEQPLFSESTDKVVVSAYRELMSSSALTLENQDSIQLAGLNFIRLLVPAGLYQQEVSRFVARLKSGYAPSSGMFFGAFPGPYDMAQWRVVLHEHLDAIMSRAEQRDLVRSIYAKWVLSIDEKRDQALLSIFDDEVRLSALASDYLSAYQIACEAEEEGIYRRDDGYGALVLLRTAERAERSVGAEVPEPNFVARHLGDEDLRRVAEEYYEAQLNGWDTLEGPEPFPEYLWDLDSGQSPWNCGVDQSDKQG